jgi:hypothetical protein
MDERFLTLFLLFTVFFSLFFTKDADTDGRLLFFMDVKSRLYVATKRKQKKFKQTKSPCTWLHFLLDLDKLLHVSGVQVFFLFTEWKVQQPLGSSFLVLTSFHNGKIIWHVIKSLSKSNKKCNHVQGDFVCLNFFCFLFVATYNLRWIK